MERGGNVCFMIDKQKPRDYNQFVQKAEAFEYRISRRHAAKIQLRRKSNNMKKLLALLMAMVMVLGLVACGSSQTAAPAQSEAAPADAAADGPLAQLIADAKAEGELVVYGSCEEDYLSAACANFEKLYGIKTTYQRLSTGEVPAKIEEENGKPSADVWFGGTNNPYDSAAAKGLLDNSYVPENASHLTKDIYKDPNGYWYGIYTGILGFMVNTDELTRLGLEAPKSWDDLLKPEYKGLVWLSNYNTAGTPKLVANLMIQLKGHDEGIKYLADLDKRARMSAPVSASSASASCMTASLRLLTTDMKTLPW